MEERIVTRDHNKPIIEEYFKEINDDLPARLKDTCGEVIDRANELVENAANVPEVINSEEEEAKASDIVSQMKKHHKIADSRRLGINALPRQSQAIINSYFETGAMEPLEKAWQRIEPGVTRFKRIKAENERREREEKARLAQEEADRQRRATEEAQRKQREAEAAAQRAIEEEKRAKEAAAKAKRDAEEAEERRRIAEARRADEEVKAAEATSKRKKDEAERAARKAKDDADKAERDRIAAEQKISQEREAAANAKTETGLAKGDLADANRNVRTATSLEKHAVSDVRKADRAAAAPIAQLSGIRGDLGSHSSLRTNWVGIIEDRQKLDLNALRDFMSDDDLQKALNKFVGVHKGGRKLKGAIIQEETETAFR